MTQEDKQLLLKDISARLPYGVKCIVTKSRTEEGQEGDVGKIGWVCLEGAECIGNEPFFSEFGNFKPYLFPLSSMTEEQKKEYQYITERWMYDSSYSISDSIDWLNKNHFDYRDLIPMGLAIAVTKENNPYK